MTQQYFIPSLQSDVGIITDMYERAAYIINYFIYNPGNISVRYNHESISLRVIAAKHGHNKKDMISVTSNILTEIYKLHFPDINVYVTCKCEDLQDITKYVLIIEITLTTDSISQPMILNKHIEIDTKTNEFRLKLRREVMNE